MAKKIIKIVRENSFDGAPGGGSGTSNYGTGYGTPNGSSQDPSKFSSSDKTTNHMASNTESTSSAMIKLPDRPDRISTNRSMSDPKHPSKPTRAMVDPKHFETDTENQGNNADDANNGGLGNDNTSPAGNFDNKQFEKPLDPERQFDTQVDKLFKGKKHTPSPDDIMSALQYELTNMVKKDKTIAKQVVLKNLQSDPQYYSALHMLNIDDKKMKVDESTYSKTKSVLDSMIADRKKGRPVAESKEISQIFKDLCSKRRTGITPTNEE